MSKIQPLFTWRSAINSPGGPEHSTTRHVLLSISLYMSEKGEGAFPSMERLSKDTGLSLRSIKKHVPLAEQTGWLKVVKKSGHGQSWKRNDYKASIPKSYYKKMYDLETKAVQEVHHEGGAGGAPQSKKVVQEVHEGGASKRNKVVQEVHPNTPYNSSKNSPERAGAREGERELSIVDRLGQAETYQECLDIWGAYRRSKGKHMAIYESDVFLNKTCKGRSVLQVKKAILHSIEHGWFKLVFPEDAQNPDPGDKDQRHLDHQAYKNVVT